MHVIKVPVVHKFGIISHCQRLQLQTRLFEELSQEKTDTTQESIRANPLEVSDEFVDNYNAVISSLMSSKESKRDMIDRAMKMFNKIKRRIGLKHNCETEPHINLALGWTELSILSQCDGSLGQETLDLLLMSLNVAPISNRAFSVLFYLLETVLYFIQVHKFDNTNPHKHIKWLLIGEIVAVRIYLHCVLKLSQNWKEKMENLIIYIKDFKKCQQQFTMFPELALSFCVIEEVTDYLIATCDNGKLSDNEPKKEEISTYHCGSFMWHAVDLCRCFSYSSFKSQIQDCIDGISGCISHNSGLGEWIECYLAIRVVANAASFNDSALDVFTSIVDGLTEANHTLIRPSDSTRDRNEKTDRVFEKGTLLLMVAMREFATLPLLATISVVREKSLSTIAEMLLTKESRITISLPLRIREVVVARIEAILDICNKNEDISGFFVIKNSIWCLLGAIKRKRILSPSEDTFSERFGRILASTLFCKDLHELPQSANNRISNILIQYLLPIFPITKESVATPTVKQERDKVRPAPQKPERQRLKITEVSKKKTPVIKRDSCYAKQADNKLKTILDNYWTQELPNLQKSLDDQ